MNAEAKRAKRDYQRAQRANTKAGTKSRTARELTPEAREAKRQYERAWRAANPDRVTATLERFYMKQASKAVSP